MSHPCHPWYEKAVVKEFVSHLYMEAILGISLYSYPYLN
jgi:hypothetical protein